ncbi:MAG: tRNA1(Val) (adenine(37)-N6)-methyltransferase [Spirochaetaceae bacterium]|nr:tRNA1(Val) (adenine(37)-N6)-methyltransferase [Spirochaetaceae bacterium]
MEVVDTLKNGYKIIQDSEKFKFGIDAILLSHFAFNQIRNNEKVIDLGTGNGIIPLMIAKSRANSIVGLEIQEENVELAKRSVELNQLEEKIQIIHGDIKAVDKKFTKHSFDVVVSNPPYMINEHGKQNPTEAKSIARHEVLCNLEDIISAVDYLLKPFGKFFMIHRPFRLPEIFSLLTKYKIEPKRMELVSPFLQKEPNLVLIEARKNANPRLQIEENLIVYEKPGIYTEKINQIYSSFV